MEAGAPGPGESGMRQMNGTVPALIVLALAALPVGVAEAAQNVVGRMGPISLESLDPRGVPWASRLAIALMWVVVSAIALTASLEYGIGRWGAWVWASSFLMSTVFAAYCLLRLS